MGQARSKNRGTFGRFSRFENVIDLGAARRRRALEAPRKVFYLSESREWSPLLESLSELQIININSNESLSANALLRQPDLILLETKIDWANPLHLIEKMTSRFDAPTVLICDPHRHEAEPELLKRAYAAGVCDTLFAPFDSEELIQVLDILLKFQSTASELRL